MEFYKIPKLILTHFFLPIEFLDTASAWKTWHCFPLRTPSRKDCQKVLKKSSLPLEQQIFSDYFWGLLLAVLACFAAPFFRR